VLIFKMAYLLLHNAHVPEGKVVDGSDSARVDAIVSELLQIVDQMAATMFRFTAREMDKADLSSNRFNALRALGSDEPLTMSALADRLKVSTAAVTSIVDKLEAEGLASRTRSTEDRRQVLVDITPRGREAVESVLKVRIDLIRYMLENVSPEMQQNWLELYRELGKVLEKKVATALQETDST
jgi:DNA-binding MarR family transcriptional regulator